MPEDLADYVDGFGRRGDAGRLHHRYHNHADAEAEYQTHVELLSELHPDFPEETHGNRDD